jgi:hypothetical protein
VAEPTDAILPILQRMQSDIADLKREVGDLKREMKTRHAAETTADALPPLTGRVDMLTGENVAAIKKEGKAVELRLMTLEGRP